MTAGQYEQYALRPEVSRTPGSGFSAMAEINRHTTDGHRETSRLKRPKGQFSENSQLAVSQVQTVFPSGDHAIDCLELVPIVLVKSLHHTPIQNPGVMI